MSITLIAIIWAAGTVAAFMLLRKCALRDFGVVTVGGVILLTLYSLIAPCALVTAAILSFEGFDENSLMNKPIWTRKAR